jgi:hypothetical protein
VHTVRINSSSMLDPDVYGAFPHSALNVRTSLLKWWRMDIAWPGVDSINFYTVEKVFETLFYSVTKGRFNKPPHGRKVFETLFYLTMCVQGCQMVYFQTQIPIWVNFGGYFNGRFWYILWPFGVFCSHLVYFVAIWCIL